MRSWLSGLVLLALVGVGAAQISDPAQPVKGGAGADNEAAEARALALDLLTATAQEVREMRVSDNRVRSQGQLGALLWTFDEKQGRALFENAAADFKALAENLAEPNDDDPNQSSRPYNLQQLRLELVRAWAQRDGEAALRFVRASRPWLEPYLPDNYGQEQQEVALEVEVATQIARTNPQAALKIARESLAQGFAGSQVNLLQQLGQLDRGAAREFARDLYDKLKDTNLLQQMSAGYVGYGLAHYAQQELNTAQQGNAATTTALSEPEIRALVERLVNAALSYPPERVTPGLYSAEYNAAQNLLNYLKQWDLVEKYMPGRQKELQARSQALQQTVNRANPWQQYQEYINQHSVSESLTKIEGSPAELRDNLYQQVAWKTAQDGNVEQARQIISERITNSANRAQALRNLDNQLFYQTINKSNLAEARTLIARMRTRQERVQSLVYLANQLENQKKPEEALSVLDEARQQLPGRPDNAGQIYPYTALMQAYARLDPPRAFEMLEPMIEQFNELAAAAEKLNGFGVNSYRNGEFMLYDGALGSFVQQFATLMPPLARSDFDRARKNLRRIDRPEVRVALALAIGQNLLGNEVTMPRGRGGKRGG